MAKRLHVLVGTKKGAFLFDAPAEGGQARREWRRRGPFCEAWPIHNVVGDAASGTIYAAGGNEWFGPAVWQTRDGGETWSHSSEGLRYAEGEAPIKAAWSFAVDDGTLYVGVEPAGLFRSTDGGKTFEHIEGLQKHPSRFQWMAGGGGLILHHIVVHPDDRQKLWVAVSAAGVFHSADGGATWEARNKGTRADYAPEEHRYPEFGQCVHSLAMAAGRPDRLYQQNHCGMYVSEDAGRTWTSIEAGLPSTFGFPAVAHPRDPDTLFLIPLNGDIHGRFMPDGKAAVWRTRDAGRTWQALRNGLPQDGAFFGVLRQAMATDRLEPAGLYFGTSSGSLYASADEGESFHLVGAHLPTITSVETVVLDV